MHKITIKGLKKKKKGKKSKHKDDDLFKPEELEAYRREHQQQENLNNAHSSITDSGPTLSKSATAGSGENEEWRKFLALTSGVDDILKKTQGDLDRIKSTSFFKRVPPPSEVKKRQEEEAAAEAAKQAQENAEFEKKQKAAEQQERLIREVQAAIVEVSESESEEENEDDIFDTDYIDVIATGEVKLAYIPESPTEDQNEDDPFDTSYADKAILGPGAERKGKKLVPLGAAVEILTGRVQAPTCVPLKRPTSARQRQVLKERDLLLGSFDENPDYNTRSVPTVAETRKTLLDEDAPSELANEPIDLTKSLVLSISKKQDQNQELQNQNQKSPIEDEDDKEFALLAAESLNKPIGQVVLKLEDNLNPVTEENSVSSWNAFEEESKEVKKAIVPETNDEEDDIDPFDTSFAENILPGQTELKLIEKEILNSDNSDFDFNSRAEDKLNELLKSPNVTIQLINPCGERETVSSLERISENELSILKPTHRDLLGGSNTDLSQLGEQPLEPKDSIDQDFESTIDNERILYSDPFDTSSIDAATLPGQTELKFLERELLGDLKTKQEHRAVEAQVQIDDDDDFDPRAEEVRKPRKVSFELPLAKTDLLGQNLEDTKNAKPLTPYYIRENSIAEQKIEEENTPERDLDPFDTSFVGTVAPPGVAELKLIEQELIHSRSDHLADQDFDPRDEKRIAIAKVIEAFNQIAEPLEKTESIDLLSVENDSLSVEAKVLTPAAEPETCKDNYIDPFDTSIANNILPGKTELKLLESELITNNNNNQSFVSIKQNLTDPEFDPRLNQSIEIANVNIDLLASDEIHVDVKPLTPLAGRVAGFNLGNGIDEYHETDDDVDPFDTSFANIGPGPSELKLLESELM